MEGLGELREGSHHSLVLQESNVMYSSKDVVTLRWSESSTFCEDYRWHHGF